MKTIVRVRLMGTMMVVIDLVTNHTELMPIDPGVVAQLGSATEGYFDAEIDDDGQFSFGDRVPPPE